MLLPNIFSIETSMKRDNQFLMALLKEQHQKGVKWLG
jgi:hypothetical protein